MKKAVFLWTAICILLFLSACGKLAPAITSTSTPSVTPTLDPCSSSNLPLAVRPVNDLMRQFDDYAALAQSTPQSQLVQVIPPLQTIRRAAENQAVPVCLKQLKVDQLSYMDTLIQTLLAFDANANSDVLKGGAAQAQQYHNQYVIELAHLLGMTVVVPPSITPGTPPTPGKTSTPALSAITITNPGPNPINLHASASLTSATVGTMNVSASAVAVGKTAAGDWVLIQVPGQTGKTVWLYATLIKFASGDINSLPVATPAP
jgi:hypothetical protein